MECRGDLPPQEAILRFPDFHQVEAFLKDVPKTNSRHEVRVRAEGKVPRVHPHVHGIEGLQHPPRDGRVVRGATGRVRVYKDIQLVVGEARDIVQVPREHYLV